MSQPKDYYKKKNIPDLYELFGLTIKDADSSDFLKILENIYQTKLKECHPDRFDGSQKKRKEVETRMIHLAYSVLINDSQRIEYNNSRNWLQGEIMGFSEMKLDAQKYETLEYQKETPEQISSFKGQMEEMNKKHGYDMSQIGPIGQKDAEVRLAKLLDERNNIYQEVKQPKLFNGPLSSSDMARFNEAFEKTHNQGKGTGELIPHDQWGAYNGDMQEFGEIDHYDRLYNDTPLSGDGNEFFANPYTNMPANEITLTPEEVSKMNGSSNYANHNVKDVDYYKQLKTRLAERKTDTTGFNARNFADFNAGQFDQFTVFEETVKDRLALDRRETLEDRYSQMQSNSNDDGRRASSGSRGTQDPLGIAAELLVSSPTSSKHTTHNPQQNSPINNESVGIASSRTQQNQGSYRLGGKQSRAR